MKDDTLASCVDWSWAVGKAGPRCNRHKSCGAVVPDLCPLAPGYAAALEHSTRRSTLGGQ